MKIPTVMMAMTLETDIDELRGITKRQRAALRALGIGAVRDLVFCLPYRYDDYSTETDIAGVAVGSRVTLTARIIRIASRRSFRRRMYVTEAVLDDGTDTIKALWFNQPYLARYLQVGPSYRFAGKVSETPYGPRLINPLYEADTKDPQTAVPWAPVYPLASGLSQIALRRLMRRCRKLMEGIEDHLPSDLRDCFGLMPLADALVEVHFPRTLEELDRARRRLAFDELLGIQLLTGLSRRQRLSSRAVPIVASSGPEDFVSSLPFRLTADQHRACREIIEDMGQDRPMYRLLNGDVGSGKTVVAALAMFLAAREAGHQAALMAPTEILAEQHFRTLTGLFAPTGLRVALWTNSYKRSAISGQEEDCRGKVATDRLRDGIEDGTVDIVVGTHALVQKGLTFGSLMLAVIDEQHRFGVNTRHELCRKGGRPDQEPHLLSMTATPIPRSLALTVYGDLDISVIREKPQGRPEVETKVFVPRQRDRAYRLVREQIERGRQAFVICPLIDPSDSLGVASVKEEHERLSNGELADIPVGLLHGKLSATEKERVMSDFVSGRMKVLVSTSVVEVGVDVPNATVMCVDGAERFGLAQLHQFRGRVGRGRHRSFCLLLPTADTPQVVGRLRILERLEDGFAVAEKDLELRGHGDLMGQEQSGFMDLRLARLSDTTLIRDTRQAAQELLQGDPELHGHPVLRRALLGSRVREVHLE